MKIFWKKFRKGIILLGGALFLAGLFYAVIKPLFASIHEKTEKIQEDIVNQERRVTKMQEVSAMAKKAESIIKESEKMEVFAKRNQVVALLEMLEKIAEETGNEIEIEMKDDKEAKAAGVGQDLLAQLPTDKYISMRITVTGKYDSIANFIKKMENMRYWADVISLRISATEDSSQNQKSNVSPFQRAIEKEEKNAEQLTVKRKVRAIIGAVFYLDE